MPKISFGIFSFLILENSLLRSFLIAVVKYNWQHRK